MSISEEDILCTVKELTDGIENETIRDWLHGEVEEDDPYARSHEHPKNGWFPAKYGTEMAATRRLIDAMTDYINHYSATLLK